MNINIIPPEASESLLPLTVYTNLIDLPVGGSNLKNLLYKKLESFINENSFYIKKSNYLNIRGDFWPSKNLINILMNNPDYVIATKINNKIIPRLWMSINQENSIQKEKYKFPDKSDYILIENSWDLLELNETIIKNLENNTIEGTIKNNVNIEGNVTIGKNTVLLPGVYIEGNVHIGENCKIGPNCYIRGKTHISDNCHIGQSVELKNSILMDGCSVGHLSYVGDSILGEKTNFGAGTITANLRHDGKTHKSMLKDKLVDTGRRKLGIITGQGVHTGINTSLYPGRKLWPFTTTLPGGIVKQDITN